MSSAEDIRPNEKCESEVQKDLKISSYLPPLFPDCTPYTNNDFHPRVKEVCSEVSKTYTDTSISKKTYWLLLKVLLVGNSNCGKAQLLQRFISDTEAQETTYISTIGIDFKIRTFNVLSVPVKMQIWDTAGQERFKSITSSYYRGAKAVVVVFNVSNPETLKDAKLWMDEACKHMQEEDFIRFLVGCNKHMKTGAELNEVEVSARQMANELKAELWFTSAETGENVKEFFLRLMTVLFDKEALRQLDSTEDKTNNIKVEQNKSEGKRRANCFK